MRENRILYFISRKSEIKSVSFFVILAEMPTVFHLAFYYNHLSSIDRG